MHQECVQRYDRISSIRFTIKRWIQTICAFNMELKISLSDLQRLQILRHEKFKFLHTIQIQSPNLCWKLGWTWAISCIVWLSDNWTSLEFDKSGGNGMKECDKGGESFHGGDIFRELKGDDHDGAKIWVGEILWVDSCYLIVHCCAPWEKRHPNESHSVISFSRFRRNCFQIWLILLLCSFWSVRT